MHRPPSGEEDTVVFITDQPGPPGGLERQENGIQTVVAAEAIRHGRLALLSMLALILQGTALAVVLRMSRTREAGAKPYLASVSVALTEAVKMAICIAVQLRKCHAAAATGGEVWSKLAARQAKELVESSLPMLLPAGMFVMQGLLLIVAASHLDAVAFQIFIQSFKLVPTAIFARLLLGQKLDFMQWASIPVLTVGVITVTLNNSSSSKAAVMAGRSAAQAAAAAAAAAHAGQVAWLVGMVACSVSGLSSAFAGVYFERYVKGKHAASLWDRNIQLGLYSVPLSIAYALAKDGHAIRGSGMLQGFDAAAWTVIALQVVGGLLVGMVVKYCDNILKNFALAISVILTVLVAIPLFGQWPSAWFLCGVGLVLLSVFMYGKVLRLPDASGLEQVQQLAAKCFRAGDPGRRQIIYALLASALTAMLVVGIWGAQQYMNAFLPEQVERLRDVGEMLRSSHEEQELILGTGRL